MDTHTHSTRTRNSPAPASGDNLRIAMLAPPWIPVPPPAYGGIESVVAMLCDELTARGHQVTLFAAPGSRSPATVLEVLDEPHPETIGSALHESDHVARAWDELDRAAERGMPFDLVHDHCGFTALAMAARVGAPVIHTLHGPFTAETAAFYERHGPKCHLVAISNAQKDSSPPGVRPCAVVPNPDDYLLWMGRMDPVKGPHRAIAAARASGRRLVLAGPVQPGQEEFFRRHVEAELDGSDVVFVGEVGGAARKELFARASALLMPIRWVEPFGMVMVEALACGTPVVAFPEGAASEIVIDGENGFLVSDEQQMSEAIERLGRIEPSNCRATVAERYGAAAVAERYEGVYRAALEAKLRPSRERRRRSRTSKLQRTSPPPVIRGTKPAAQTAG